MSTDDTRLQLEHAERERDYHCRQLDYWRKDAEESTRRALWHESAIISINREIRVRKEQLERAEATTFCNEST